MLFTEPAGSKVKLSEDRRTIQKSNESGNQWVFLKNDLEIEKNLLLHVIKGELAVGNSLEILITTDNLSECDFKSLTQDNADKCLKNSWWIKGKYCSYISDESNSTIEEIDIDFQEIQEDDIIGFTLNSKYELWYSFHGKLIDKIADDVSSNVWIALNLTEPSSVTMISILRDDNPILESHAILYKNLLKKTLRNPIRFEFNRKTPLEFHSKSGSQIEIRQNWTTKGIIGYNTIARRRNPIIEFRNAVVISAQELLPDQLFQLRIEGCVNKWNGSIEFGVTEHDPNFTDLPATLTNMRAGTLIMSENSILTNGQSSQSPYSTKSLDNLKIGDLIGVERRSNGYIYFYINNINLGKAGFIDFDKKLWVIADLYGRTIKVSVVQPHEVIDRDDEPTASGLSPSESDQNECIDQIMMKKTFPKYRISSFSIDESNLISFHQQTGTNVNLLQNGMVAKRINSSEFKNGVLFTSRPLKIGEGFFIKLANVVDSWSGNLEFGITNLSPDMLGPNFPPTMTYIVQGENVIFTTNGIMHNGHSLMSRPTEYIVCPYHHPIINYGVPQISKDTIFGFKLISHTKVNFFMNCANLGTITINNPEHKALYGIVDLYGKAEQVQIMRCEDDVLRCKLIDTNSPINSEDERGSFDIRNLLGENVILDPHLTLPMLNAILVHNNTNNTTVDETPIKSKIVFHSKHGRNVLITNERRTATTYPLTDPSGLNVTLMSSRRLLYNELFEIKIEDLETIQDCDRGTMKIGLCNNFPKTNSSSTLFNNQNEKYFENNCRYLQMNKLWNLGSLVSQTYPLNLSHISKHYQIGVIHKSNGYVHFYLNGNDMGKAFDLTHLLHTDYNWYAFVDLNGHCKKLSITEHTSQIYQDTTNGQCIYADTDEEENDAPSRLVERYCDNYDNNDEVRHIMLELLGNDELERDRNQEVVSASNLFNSKSLSSDGSPESFSNLERATTSNDKEFCESFCLDIDKHKKLTLFDSLLCGNGAKSKKINNALVYQATSHSSSCLVRSNVPLESNSFHELIFSHNNKTESSNEFHVKSDSLIFGFVSYPHNINELSIPNQIENLNLPCPNWLIFSQDLYINNRLVKRNFSLGLIKRNEHLVRIGIYLFNNGYMELFINGVPVSHVIPSLPNNLYLIADLRGWFDTFLVTQSMSVLDVDYHPYESINYDIKYLIEDILDDFVLLDKFNQSTNQNVTSLQDELSETKQSDLMNDLIFRLVPIFMKYIKQNFNSPEFIIQKLSNEKFTIELSKDVLSKIEASILPLVLLKHPDLLNASQELIQSNLINKLIKPVLMKEVASYFGKVIQSHEDTKMSAFSIARQLEIQVQLDSVKMNHDRLVIIPPNSLVQYSADNPNCISRNTSLDQKENFIPGSNNEDKFGLVYLNQTCHLHDLISKEGRGDNKTAEKIWNSHKLVVKKNSTISQSPIRFGFILIPTNQMIFPCTSAINRSHQFEEDKANTHNTSDSEYLRFYTGSKSPQQLSSLSNQIRSSLQIQRYEMPSLIVVIADGSVFLNEIKIIDHIGFTLDKLSQGGDEGQLYFSVQHEDRNVTFSLVNILSNKKRQRYVLFDIVQALKLTNADLYLDQYDNYRATPFLWMKNSEITIHVKPISSEDTRNISLTNLNTTGSLSRRLINHRKLSYSPVQACDHVAIANFVRESVCVIPNGYFVSHHHHHHHHHHNTNLLDCVCYCSKCMTHMVTNSDSITDGNDNGNEEMLNDEGDDELVLIGEPACQTRLPIGYVKYPINLKKEIRAQISKWHMAYLTVSYAYLHEILTVPNPLKKLMSLKKNDKSLLVLWLHGSEASNDDSSKSVVVSPWKPLIGCYLSEQNTIETFRDAYVKFQMHSSSSMKEARLALEVRIKPNSYKFAEFKNQTMETDVEKKNKDKKGSKFSNERSRCSSVNEQNDKEKVFELKDEADNNHGDHNEVLSLSSSTLSNGSSHSKISQKTVWILNKNSEMVITGLLVMPID